MEAEKKRSKGGFLNLFDWNGKSRKKLFANNPDDLPGTQEPKQEKEGVQINPSKPNNCTVDLDENENENEMSSSNKGSGDWNSASCVTSDDGSGPSRAPGVVARLMGLDSLPSSNIAEPSFISAPLSEVTLLRPSHHDRTNQRSNFYSTNYANVSNRLEPFLRSHRQQNMPIERFQTEVLPPRSAKSIPITHHKLLSPIKNPGFVPTKNATYIMEAAAKIVEASPRSYARTKVSSGGTSSVPLRIRDLKEKLEAANKASSRPGKPKEVGASRYSRGQYSNKSPNGSEYVLVTRASVDSEKRNVHSTRDKGRSVSPSVQAKTVLQRRDVSSTSCGGKSFGNRKEQKEVKLNPLSKCQPNVQRSELRRTSPDSSNNVLRPNNQKQNCVSNKDKLVGKNSVSNNMSRRTGSSNVSNKGASNSKTGSRKTGSVVTNTRRDISSSAVKNGSQKKKSVSSDIRSEEVASSSGLIGEVERSIKCNVSMDSCSSMSPESRKLGMDVISFTFNSPLKKSPRESQSSGHVEKRFGINSISDDKDQHIYSNGFVLSSPGVNVIGADSLSALLEQKLLELTSKVQLYESKRLREESSASCASASEDSNVVSDVSRGKQVQICLLRDKDKADSINGYGSLSIDGQSLGMNQHWQDREECSGSSNNTGKEVEFDDLSPESSFELSFESGSFTDNRNCSNGSKGCSLTEAQSHISLSCESEYIPEYSAIESSESTPLSSARNNNDVKQTTRRFGSDDLDRPTNWELEYVRNVVVNAELAVEDFALGDADEVITRNLFDHLESEEFGSGEGDCSKLGKKVLFDSVNECLESRCKNLYLGTCSRWARLSPRKEWLVEELYEEISGWKLMADWMLDELVDKDMSTRTGRWVDFDQEAFEEGVEVENAILNSLIDELVSDLLAF